MKVHVITPYSVERNLGAAYNECFRNIGQDDWVCLTDYDILFLLPDTIKHLTEYPKYCPEADVFTCFTNRSHTLSKNQLLDGVVSDNTDIRYHIKKAVEQKKHLYEATELNNLISGYLMMVSKKTWDAVKFTEDMKCLGVDTYFNKCLKEKGKKVYRMSGVYVWHTYRLLNGVADKSHLL